MCAARWGCPPNFDPQTLRWTAPPFVAEEALRRLPFRLAAKFRGERPRLCEASARLSAGCAGG